MIEIACTAADTLPLSELKDFQGDLKTISEENLGKLKKSILKYGFSVPVFIWRNNGINYILDTPLLYIATKTGRGYKKTTS